MCSVSVALLVAGWPSGVSVAVLWRSWVVSVVGSCAEVRGVVGLMLGGGAGRVGGMDQSRLVEDPAWLLLLLRRWLGGCFCVAVVVGFGVGVVGV